MASTLKKDIKLKREARLMGVKITNKNRFIKWRTRTLFFLYLTLVGVIMIILICWNYANLF